MWVRNAVAFFVVVFTLVISIGCRTQLVLQLKPPAKYLSFSGGEQVGEEFLLDADSDVYKSLQKWLGKERKWKRDWNSYAPKNVVESRLLRINYLEKTVVLSIRKNETDTWNQFSCKADKDIAKVFEEIRSAAAGSVGSRTGVMKARED